MDTISNMDDMIDSRSVIERIEELEAERDEYQERDLTEPLTLSWSQAHDDDAAELVALKALAEEAEGCADWKYGEALIRDSYFRDYAEQLADDIGAINSEARWPNNCIDWERAAGELQMDYTSVDFDGITYWIRS